jgi:hypothetical protein
MKSEACVFLGPSLPRETASGYLPRAEFLPPVRAGDVRTAVEREFTVIGIIDGLFEQVASVWHKEILFALSRGVWVYGAASMGALRAAELHAFGMVGVGAIFDAYRSGQWEDDDEVAVSHAASEHGFRPLSDALASLRFGLARAAASGIITEHSRQVLLRSAKSRFYPERSWKALLVDGKRAGIDADELQRFEAWVNRENPDQKRDDAITLLERMAGDMKANPGPFRPTFTFEPTAFWDRAESALQEKWKAARNSELTAETHATDSAAS